MKLKTPQKPQEHGQKTDAAEEKEKLLARRLRENLRRRKLPSQEVK